jgi:4-aminobutyrate aminotransferase-like enzyme
MNGKEFKMDQLKKDLLQAHLKSLESICGIQEPQKDVSEIFDSFGESRGGQLWYPYIGSGRGRGPLVELIDGSVKYDLINGIGVHGFGHSNPEFLEAQINASLEDTCMQGNLQQNIANVSLLKDMLQLLNKDGAKMDHVFLSTSGAMANENALKIAFQNKGGSRVFAFRNNFAGRSMSMSAISDKPQYRQGLPYSLHVDCVPFYDANEPEKSLAETIKMIKQQVHRYPGEHAMMIFELVQGEGGFYPGSKEFFEPIMQLLQQENILVWIDEVQTFGRTGEAFAFQHYGLSKYIDLVTLGKMSQVCATVFKTELKPRPGLISQTFTSSSSAIHCAKVVFKKFLTEPFFGVNGEVENLHNMFVDSFAPLKKEGLISGPHGIGTMFAFQVLDGSLETTKTFLQHLFSAGLIAFATGSNPYRVRFLLPLGCLQAKEVAEITNSVRDTIVKLKHI